MLRTTHSRFFLSIALATAAVALWCGLSLPLAADVGTPPLPAARKQQPPISCKVSAKGVLTDCHVNDGYSLDDVANWFQDEHDRTLRVAVDSVTVAKKVERSYESCVNEKEHSSPRAHDRRDGADVAQ